MSAHCCDPNENPTPKAAPANSANTEHTDDGHGHGHTGQKNARWEAPVYLFPLLSLLLLLSGIGLDHFRPGLLPEAGRVVLYTIAYLLVGWNVLVVAYRKILLANIFTEFTLMSIATIGAFAIGEYAEGVTVMLFYTVGELFNEAAVQRAKRSIQALLDIRPDTVTVLRNGISSVMNPRDVQSGEIIVVKPGEKVALDGELLTAEASFNTAALTGESRPDTRRKGEQVLAGMINLTTPAEIRTTGVYEDSALARILSLVQNALSKKSQSERFMTKFAKIYTPFVVFAALALVFLPYFFTDPYIFRDWLYRGLVFLVISCPCALVISIPLGYFGGIGAGSRNGILFKGSNFLDLITTLDTVVVDKTGTMTKGVFTVQQVRVQDMNEQLFLDLAAALESRSTHPVAQAIVAFRNEATKVHKVEQVEEISGHGLKGTVDGYEVLAGNTKLLAKFGIGYPAELDSIPDTLVAVAVNGRYTGYLTIADELREDAAAAVQDLHRTGITRVLMLSGDKEAVVRKVAAELGISEAYGNLLPADKVSAVEKLKDEGRRVAFIGDGVNDAPVVALADVGMAIGGLGSDATIETADVVIQTDQPSRIATAIRIGRATKRIVWQNIFLAFFVKAIVLGLGAWGVASLWEAVFADVGVALLAILNAVRIQNMKFHS